MPQQVYLNGAYVDATEAKISVFDRGFLFADAIYEVIPATGNCFFLAKEHLTRLEQSLAAVDMQMPLSTTEWIHIFHQLLQRNQACPQHNYAIYLQVSRGHDGCSRQHAINGKETPTVLALLQTVTQKHPEAHTQGISVITTEDLRRKQCYIKATGLMPNALALQKAKNQDADDAILIRDGLALEATSSNLFVVKNNILMTPIANQQILRGVTRQLILQLAAELHMTTQECNISETALLSADEVFITGSLKGIWPVTSINKQPVADGAVGPYSKKLLQAFANFLKNYIQQHRAA